MKRTYIVTIEVDAQELADINAKRLKLGQQQREVDLEVELEVCNALTSKLFSDASCVPVVEGIFREGVDPDASL